ncbi:putative Transcription elongation factor A protein 1 [Blattamonas nauphoetae]|uniref:Transcription elongation factor A protein 1 n=1 Tax=Blattamonas nauphoetae TaxID=2049346 RepID=A0ABQ9XD72_9EUKA|nr:putative Transcription elongation factor A protein 1 [Blattamonas nauphoetae]
MNLTGDELYAIKDELEKLVPQLPSTETLIIEKLQNLERSSITTEVLQVTKFGLYLRTLTKNQNEKIKKLAMDVMTKWKTQIQTQSEQKSNSDNHPPTGLTPSPTPSITKQKREESTPSPSPSLRSEKKVFSSKADRPDPDDLPLFRVKSRDLICKKLKLHSSEDESVLRDLARQIENGIFDSIPNPFSQADYHTQTLEIIQALARDSSFAHALVEGQLDPDVFGRMSYQELASEKLKADRKMWMKEALEDSKIGTQMEGTYSDFWKCGKCGQKKCTFRQQQTRSADEPMTTFITCAVCGNRWRE